MKKNGFTLIELITVIALLSIVGVIVTPKISKAFKVTHADQLEEIRTTLKDATEVYLNNECGKTDFNSLKENNRVKIQLSNISDCGLIKSKLYNPVSGKNFDIKNEYVEVSLDEVGLLEYKMSF